jgi:hypothetical protein
VGKVGVQALANFALKAAAKNRLKPTLQRDVSSRRFPTRKNSQSLPGQRKGPRKQTSLQHAAEVIDDGSCDDVASPFIIAATIYRPF